MMIGHGLAEASVQLRLQQVLPDHEQSVTLMERYQGRISRAVAQLEKQVGALSPGARGRMRMDKICAVIGLGHVELRHGDEWRAEAPKLAAWYDDAMLRPSLKETALK